MTINSYTPEQLDSLSMRFFDLAAYLRQIAQQARSQELRNIPIHDRKALQWCENLEIWVKKTDLYFRISLQEQKADGLIDLGDD